MDSAIFCLGVVAMLLGLLWFEDRDDARLDALRETAVEACADKTETVGGLGDCVTATIAATGQKGGG